MSLFQYNPAQPGQARPGLHLLFWGKEACVPGHAVGPGIRDVYKVHFIHQGKGTVRIGDSVSELGPGQAFLIYPQVVTYYEADRDNPWTYSWIGFDGSEVQRLLERTRLRPEQPVFPMDLQVMPSLVERMTESLGYEGTLDLRLSILLQHFWAALIDEFPASPDNRRTDFKKQDGYIHQGLEFLHAHYSEQISISQLASYMGLDRKYLSVIFKEAVGLPPQQYLLHYRMERASKLLRSSSYSVSEVAGSVGYRDALLFSRMFKKVVGLSPKQYREQVQEEDINP
ncbi:AraC family transcriptional regulator [Paenibacillus sp. GCM10012307]|uniref:AraC family transcriptional regulator n=1 Tax=Paenibacillus roseus TaxID=2798579 RepID=A0A934MKF0_9BACL|nr:AraC family transcriptional regulator [Paenibacillus roseus]MBJ6360970.1 AraC family transcriptional regulator [Paenibacillus roseus]